MPSLFCSSFEGVKIRGEGLVRRKETKEKKRGGMEKGERGRDGGESHLLSLRKKRNGKK